MTDVAVFVDCPSCKGHGYHWPPPPGVPWAICRACDSHGRVFAPGGPAFGCTITLADREPGEIVTLGNGQRARILWHQPRRAPKVVPVTTFLGLIDDFDDYESHVPHSCPSIVGVRSVQVSHLAGDASDHLGERGDDPIDPLHRQARATQGALI